VRTALDNRDSHAADDQSGRIALRDRRARSDRSAKDSAMPAQAIPGLGLDKSDDDSLRALQFILEAWEEGEIAGVAPELMAYAALYTALTDLVGSFGEHHVSTLIDGLRGRVLGGEFTMCPRTQ
jgi:hypothetical protein